MTEIWKDVQIVYSLSSMKSSFFNVVVEILYMFSTFQSKNIVFVQCSSNSFKKKNVSKICHKVVMQNFHFKR